jgi:hypothetical protein
MEVLQRRRYVMLVIAGVSISLAIAGSLAFLSTWELAFTGEPSLFGTPLPTEDPDNYFFLAAASMLAALGALFAGAVWPGRRPAPRVPARTPPRSSAAGRGQAPARRPGAGASQARTSPAGRTQVKQPTSSARQVPPRQSASRQTTANQTARRPAPKR